MFAHRPLAALLILGALATPVQADPPAAAGADTGNPTIHFIQRYTSAAQQLVLEGLGYLGIPYRFGGTSPETGLDCSGLVQQVFRNALGLDMPRTAAEMARVGDRVAKDDLKPGDLVFFNTMRRTFSHVGIYLGDNRFLHAPSTGGKVRVDDMTDSYWLRRFTGARRVMPEAGLGFRPPTSAPLHP
jgi:cell wall-associated NlpC family hydrolase